MLKALFLLVKILFGMVILSCIIIAFWFFSPQALRNIPLLKDYIPSTSESLVEHAQKHSDANYVCPMHPQIVKGKPGSCPICGMNLVKKEPLSAPKETLLEHAQKHSDPQYVCPMHPQIVKGKPGSCPICGMNLVKKKITRSNSSVKIGRNTLPSITIKANTAQRMGVKTEQVKRRTLSRSIQTVGTVGYNEDNLHHIHTRTSGWVERIHVSAVGDHVEIGHPLLELYSPDIVAAQQDLLLIDKSRQQHPANASRILIKSAKQKLRLLAVPDHIISRILRTGKPLDRIPILAPKNGVVISMDVRGGMYVTPGTEMYTISDLSSVWVLVDVFEHQLDWVKYGDNAEISVNGLPGETWSGKVEYIYPELNPKNRTLRVRIKLNNENQRLKPNMFADVTLRGSAKKVLSIPKQSVIYYEETLRVIKKVGDHEYQPVNVSLGMSSGDYIEVLTGLSDSDSIVTSGQFMMDSESNLQASLQRLMETK